MKIDEKRAAELVRAYETDRIKKTRELILSKNEIGDAEVAVLAEILRVNNKVLESLALEGNPIGNFGAECLAEALMTNTTLRSLGIYFKKPRSRREISIRADGAGHIARALKVNTSLLTLDLNGNKIGDRGATEIARALLENCTLESLDVRYNGIRDRGAAALAKSIKENTNTALTDLMLDGNSLGDDGTYAIFDSLRRNSTLQKVSLPLTNMGRPYSRRTSRVISQALSENMNLTELDMSFNNMEEGAAEEISKGMMTNTSLTKMKLAERYKDYFDKVLERNNSLLSIQLDHALSADDVWTWNRSKLNVIGGTGTGKTAVVRSLLGRDFSPKKVPTKGMETVHVVTNGPKKPWERLSPNKFTAKIGGLIALQNVIVMRDSESVRLSERLKRKKFAEARKSMPRQKEVSRVEREDMHTYEEIKAEIKTYDKHALLDTLKHEEQLQFLVCDYGDQSLAHTVQHLFLLRHGIYLIVFNMAKLARRNTTVNRDVAELQFWLTSARIHVQGAPVYLVGTHVDKVRDRDVDTLNERVTNMVNTIGIEVQQNERRDMMFFPVNNRTRKGIRTLQQHIMQTAPKLEHVNSKVALSWMITMDNMLDRKAEIPWLWMSEAKDIAFVSGVTSEKEITDMLTFFHDLGVLFYFHDSVELQERVILDAGWLVEAISIDRRLVSVDLESLKKARLTKELDGLLRHGMASIDLLEHLMDKKELHFIINLMSKLMLLSKFTFNNQERYLIPSMIREHFHEIECKGLAVIMDFTKSVLPIGLFERLVCLMVAESASIPGSPEPQLEMEAAKLWLGPNAPIYLKSEKSSVHLYVENADDANKALSLLLSFVRKLKDDLDMDLEWKMAVVGENQIMVDYEMAKRRKLAPWFDRAEINENMDRRESIESFLEGEM